MLASARFVSALSDALLVYVRHWHNGIINVNFWMVKSVARGDAQTDVVAECLKNVEPKYETKLVALGTDGASVMVGKHTGVVQRLREKVKRSCLIGGHCNEHKLELAYKDAVSDIPLYNKIYQFLHTLYAFYKISNVNRSGPEA